MAKVLCVLGSARKDGYTIRVLKEAIKGAKSVGNVQTEAVHLLDYNFGPCTSCYSCIRDKTHRCVLSDDMGMRGEGILWKKVENANGLIIASPVHFWTPDALTHLFIERLYPFIWSGELKGMPVATIAVASNQGFHIAANRILCLWSFTLGLKYVGGLPVHAANMSKALRKAFRLGAKIGEAALKDELEGRSSMTDLERWLYYQDKPWKVFPNYLENLTFGTCNPDLSIISEALSEGAFKKRESQELLKKADGEFSKFKQRYSLGKRVEAIECLVKASAYWTHATWKEFLEDVIGVPPPKTYRRIESQEKI